MHPWFNELTLEVFLTTVDIIKDGVAQRVLLHFYLEDFQMSPASRFLKVCGDLIHLYLCHFFYFIENITPFYHDINMCYQVAENAKQIHCYLSLGIPCSSLLQAGWFPYIQPVTSGDLVSLLRMMTVGKSGAGFRPKPEFRAQTWPYLLLIPHND